MPRRKHAAWVQRLHVPLIARFPSKYQHLVPAEPGSVIDGLATLMDLGSSALLLPGIDPPDHMQGRPIFRHPKGNIKCGDYVFGIRDRRNARPEMVRIVHDQRYRYQRNPCPHLPFKPYEDVAADPTCADVLERMRGQIHDWMLATRDLGLLDDTEMLEREKGAASPWDLGQSLEHYGRVLETANLQLQGQSAIPELIARSKDAHSAARYWAVLGLAVARQRLRAPSPRWRQPCKMSPSACALLRPRDCSTGDATRRARPS